MCQDTKRSYIGAANEVNRARRAGEDADTIAALEAERDEAYRIWQGTEPARPAAPRTATPYELRTARAYRIPGKGYLVNTPVGWLAAVLTAEQQRSWTYSTAIAWAADQIGDGEPTRDSRIEAERDMPTYRTR